MRRREDRSLAVEPEDRPVHVGFPEQHASVVHKVSGRKIVGAIDDDVVILEDLKGVRAIDRMLVETDIKAGVECQKFVPGALDLGTAHVRREMDDLALKV